MSSCRYRLFAELPRTNSCRPDLRDFSDKACSLYETILDHDFYKPVVADKNFLSLQFVSHYHLQLKHDERPLSPSNQVSHVYLVKIDKKGNCFWTVHINSASVELNEPDSDEIDGFKLENYEFSFEEFREIDPKVETFHERIIEPLVTERLESIRVIRI